MDVQFYLDPETGQPHVFEHGVSEGEVIEVLRRPGEDRAGQEDSRVGIGQTTASRVFVITAYDLVGKPLKAYRRRQRRTRK